MLEELGVNLRQYRPEDIRLNLELINLFVEVNRLVGEDAQKIAPTFCEVYQAVMLRPIGEYIPHGNECI